MIEGAIQKNNPFVSIVIPTYNRSAILSRCLDSLCNQTFPKDRYEIIVINDGSKDTTEDILRKFEKKASCRFIWSTQENNGRSSARNSGIAKSKGELICFIDDDCIAERDWIKNLTAGFAIDAIGAVGGKIISYKTNTPLQQFIDDSGSVDQETFIKRNTLITGNAAYRRHVVADIKGFDSRLIACEDLDISIKTQLLDYKIRYIPDAVVYHDHPATVKGFFSQQFRNGTGFVQLHRKYGQKYNLAYTSSISWGKILCILICYPFTLIYALIAKKKKYYVLEPLYYVIANSAFSLGIVEETFCGVVYRDSPPQRAITSMGFMENKPISFLLRKIMKKVRNYPNFGAILSN
jgi:cellulose synthase/poly-beta-1,6-N-acetylglucosamine synthase-like glycosyltransferase